MKYTLLICFLVIIACNTETKELTAQQIIDKSIIYSGADKVANSIVSFSFRNKNYRAKRNNGKFELQRTFDSIKDQLTNNGFERFIFDKKQIINDSIADNFSNSVNSVHYFSVLPYGLNDKAVKKKLLPSTTINGKKYYKIQISFSENGGGTDFEDVFIYWIGKKDFLVDYLAYTYHTNGGGMRFRVLKEQCVKEGIRFVDYQNYKPIDALARLVNLDKDFEKNKLEKVSEIVLENIKVNLLN